MDDFDKKYEEAVEGLSDEELEQVANLDQKKLKEWVNSPTKIRPFLLKKWNEQKSPLEKVKDPLANLGKSLKKMDKKIAEASKKRTEEIKRKAKFL